LTELKAMLVRFCWDEVKDRAAGWGLTRGWERSRIGRGKIKTEKLVEVGMRGANTVKHVYFMCIKFSHFE